MIVANTLSGGSQYIQSYQIGAVANVAGESLYASVVAGAGAGLLTAPTAGTVALNYVGHALNVATPSVVQGSAESLARCVINPDAVIRSRMAGSATSGSDILIATVTTADSTGLTVVDSTLTMSRLVDGIVWGISGANVGQTRIVTSDSSSTATVTQPFDNAIVVGDTFGFSTVQPAAGKNEVITTTDATEVDVSTTLDTAAAIYMPLAVDVHGVADSFILMVPADSVFGGNAGFITGTVA